MSDTRTIYLLTKDNIYCSDPKIKQSTDFPVTYLDMSDFDNLNPTRGTVVSGLAGAVSTYEPYDATITLTFKNRQERAEWIQKNSEQVYQIAVANTISQNRVYNKKCAITSFEFVENPYTNGIQTVLTIKLFGKWQSSLTEIEINSGTYSGGTKFYSVDVPIREIGENASGVAGEPEEDGRVPYTHTAWSWSSDGKDRFTTSYPGENLLANSAGPFKPIGPGTTDNYQVYSNATIHLVQGEIYTISGKTNGIFSSLHDGITESDRTVLWFGGQDMWVIVSSDTTGTTGTSFVWVAATGTYNIRVNTYHPASTNTIYAENIKVESGKVATIYTPAPSEDPANAYPVYRGEYTDYTEADSTDPSVYNWGTPRVKKTYAYNSELKYGVTHYVSAIKLEGERGFVLATKPRNGGLTVNLQSKYNGHQFALESNWPSLITGLSSDFVAYPFTSFIALNRFTMLAGGTVTSYGWNIENNEIPYLYEMFNNVEKYPVSVGAVDQNGTVIPIHVYTYTAQDFI